MKALYLGIGILGVLLILSGGIFALQGAGKIGGSLMTGNPFWIWDISSRPDPDRDRICARSQNESRR